MESRRWKVRLAAAGVWLMASLTWGAIAHHLWGLPDLGAGLAVVTIALVLVLPPQRGSYAAGEAIPPGLLDTTGSSRP